MKVGIESGRQSTYYNQEQLIKQFSTFAGNLLLEKIEYRNEQFLSEKTPANVLFFKELQELFDNAKFIFVVRDPRGIISSFQKVAKRAENHNEKVPIGNNIFKDVAKVHKYLKAGNKFWIENPDSCYCIIYDNLVINPKREIEKLCAFLKVPFNEEMLNTEKKNDSSKLIKENNKTTRAWYTSDMYDRKIDSKGQSQWKKELNASDLTYINHFFSNNTIQCLENYVFEKPTLFSILPLTPAYYKHFGVFSLFRVFRKKIFQV